MKFINRCIFTSMNQVRMINPTTNNVTYCQPSAVRDLRAIGFIEQPEPQLEEDLTEKKPTTKNKKNATNN